jgi:hypothetical protein
MFFDDLDIDAIGENVKPQIKELTVRGLSLIANGYVPEILDAYFDTYLVKTFYKPSSESDALDIVTTIHYLKMIYKGEASLIDSIFRYLS